MVDIRLHAEYTSRCLQRERERERERDTHTHTMSR